MTDREKRLELTDLINKGWEMCTRTRCEECVFSEIKNCRMQYVAAYLLNHGVTVGGAKSATATWIPVAEGLPKEHDSIFVKFYGTDSFLPGMFLTTSDDVIAAVTYEDGTRCTKVMRTQDGKWNLRYAPGAKRVTHWMPRPEPPEEVDDAQ